LTSQRNATAATRKPTLGGLIKDRHDEVRDELIERLEEAGYRATHQVAIVPRGVLRLGDLDDTKQEHERRGGGLEGDLEVRGL